MRDIQQTNVSVVCIVKQYDSNLQFRESMYIFIGSARIPLRVDPLSPIFRAAAAAQISCFKSAENQAASSLWVGGHRYMSILCASKLAWAYRGDLPTMGD